MVELLTVKRVDERFDSLGLSNNLGERAGSVFPCENLICHGCVLGSSSSTCNYNNVIR